MSTTRQDLIDGFNMIIREGLRITDRFSDDDWKKQVHDDEGGGWNRKQVYSHITAIAEIAPNMAPNLAAVPEGGDAASGVDIHAMNSQLVAAKASLSEDELRAAFKSAYEKLVAAIQAMPDEQLNAKTKFGNAEGTVADVVDSLIVLHAIAHIYSAGGAAIS